MKITLTVAFLQLCISAIVICNTPTPPGSQTVSCNANSLEYTNN